MDGPCSAITELIGRNPVIQKLFDGLEKNMLGDMQHVHDDTAMEIYTPETMEYQIKVVADQYDLVVPPLTTKKHSIV
jgi:hypothetical protein